MSKVAKRIVVEKLVSHLQEQDLLPRLQSAYRRHHSTMTALLRVLSDIYAAADRQDVTLLGLLELSATFDCVNHDILVRRLQQSFGICGTALEGLQSFLHGRTQQVCYNGQLFLLYTAELFDIISSAGLVGHAYADDTQVYISAPAASASVSMQRFIACVEQ